MLLEGSTSLGRIKRITWSSVTFPGDVPMRLFDAEGAENWVQTHRKWEQDSQQVAPVSFPQGANKSRPNARLEVF